MQTQVSFVADTRIASSEPLPNGSGTRMTHRFFTTRDVSPVVRIDTTNDDGEQSSVFVMLNAKGKLSIVPLLATPDNTITVDA